MGKKIKLKNKAQTQSKPVTQNGKGKSRSDSGCRRKTCFVYTNKFFLRNFSASVEDLEENFELEPESSKADKNKKKRKNKGAEVGACKLL